MIPKGHPGRQPPSKRGTVRFGDKFSVHEKVLFGTKDDMKNNIRILMKMDKTDPIMKVYGEAAVFRVWLFQALRVTDTELETNLVQELLSDVMLWKLEGALAADPEKSVMLRVIHAVSHTHSLTHTQSHTHTDTHTHTHVGKARKDPEAPQHRAPPQQRQ